MSQESARKLLKDTIKFVHQGKDILGLQLNKKTDIDSKKISMLKRLNDLNKELENEK